MLKLEPRPQLSRFWSYGSPILALAVTVVIGVVLFALLGKDPVKGLQVFFWEPIKSGYALGELMVKATPLLIIALGLAVCFRSNVWNIGAEGQFVFGAIAAGGVALLADKDTGGVDRRRDPAGRHPGRHGVGRHHGAAARPVQRQRDPGEPDAGLRGDAAARLHGLRALEGPAGYNFPQTKTFEAVTQIPRLIKGSRVSIGLIIALAGAAALWVFLFRTRAGFAQQVGGLAPAAARYAGFSARRALWIALLTSGGAAGLAGALEVAGPIGQLTPYVPAGYGFAAIIVAFVGRLHPVGMIFSAILMSMFYIGGELAQSRLGLPKSLTGVFQGLLLFTLLACDTLIAYRIRRKSAPKPVAAPPGTSSLQASTPLTRRPSAAQGPTEGAMHDGKLRTPPRLHAQRRHGARDRGAGPADQREGRHRQPRRRGHDAVRRHRRLRHRRAPRTTTGSASRPAWRPARCWRPSSACW